MFEILDQRPIVVAIAGPNGAGKSTFFRAHVEATRLRFVNADVLAQEMGLGAYAAAKVADGIRRRLVEQGESFVFETVFSDPVGEKITFLKEVEGRGHTVVLIFIGIDGPATSEERVAMRVLKGGHDVPKEKIASRYDRTMENLGKSLDVLSNVLVYDNSDLAIPFRLVASRRGGGKTEVVKPVPKWLKPLLPRS